MKLRSCFLVVIVFSFVFQFSSSASKATEICWDEWGVPHIVADSEKEMFFGLGWSHMKNHANLILELYGRSRGRAAEYWGKQHLENDILIHRLRFPQLAKTWTQNQDAQYSELVKAFVAGLNACAAANPEA